MKGDIRDSVTIYNPVAAKYSYAVLDKARSLACFGFLLHVWGAGRRGIGTEYLLQLLCVSG